MSMRIMVGTRKLSVARSDSISRSTSGGSKAAGKMCVAPRSAPWMTSPMPPMWNIGAQCRITGRGVRGSAPMAAMALMAKLS